jgi:hypothetical protein
VYIHLRCLPLLPSCIPVVSLLRVGSIVIAKTSFSRNRSTHARSVIGNETFTVGNTTGTVTFVGNTGNETFHVGSGTTTVMFGKDVMIGGGFGPNSHGWGPGRGVGLKRFLHYLDVSMHVVIYNCVEARKDVRCVWAWGIHLRLPCSSRMRSFLRSCISELRG